MRKSALSIVFLTLALILGFGSIVAAAENAAA